MYTKEYYANTFITFFMEVSEMFFFYKIVIFFLFALNDIFTMFV